MRLRLSAILLILLILLGGCTPADAGMPVEDARLVEPGAERAASTAVTSFATVPAVEATLVHRPTKTPTPAPLMTVTPAVSGSPAQMEAATATAMAAPTPVPHVRATVRALNLRAGPGTNYEVRASLPGGTQMQVRGRNEGGDWLLVEIDGRSGWVAARFVAGVSDDLPILPTPPAPTATPEPSPEAPTPPASVEPSTVVLGPDTIWPVRAERIVGWGYELVDASKQWDLVLQRDVFGVVAHEFWGERLYDQHPHGIRITLIDPVWDGNSPTPLAPLPLFAGDPSLLEGFGDGAGSMIYVGCAFAQHHYYDPQACFIAIASGGEHLTDIIVAATITAQHAQLAGYFARTPDFSQPPFHLLGRAYREGDQWRWEDPFLKIIPAL